MTHKQGGYLKIVGSAFAILISIFTIVGFANKGVDERIDSKITTHEAVFEAKQQEDISQNTLNNAVLSQQIADVKSDTEDIKRILERIERDD